VDYIHALGRHMAQYKPELGWQWFYTDHLGSTRLLDGPESRKDMRREYYPFGEEYTAAGDERTAYTFTGKEKDSSTGLQYFVARYYLNKTGRFLTIDPISIRYPSLTPYNYCANNPLVYIDPNGEIVQLIAGGDTLNYQIGMTYRGENKTILGMINHLNSLSNFRSGNMVLSKLIASAGTYNMLFNQPMNDGEGGGFTPDNRGGGRIDIGTGSDNMFTIAHEVFHAYQYNMGVGHESWKAETESYLFGYALAMATKESIMLPPIEKLTAQAYWFEDFKKIQ
jgi:RHS repeat-associated protein